MTRAGFGCCGGCCGGSRRSVAWSSKAAIQTCLSVTFESVGNTTVMLITDEGTWSAPSSPCCGGCACGCSQPNGFAGVKAASPNGPTCTCTGKSGSCSSHGFACGSCPLSGPSVRCAVVQWRHESDASSSATGPKVTLRSILFLARPQVEVVACHLFVCGALITPCFDISCICFFVPCFVI